MDAVAFLALAGGLVAGLLLYLYERKRHQKTSQALTEQQQKYQQLDKDVIRLRADKEYGEKSQQLHNQLMEQAREQMKKDFVLLSNTLFEEKNRTFSERNKEILAPLREQLRTFRNRIDEIHSNEARSQSSLLTEIKKLSELNTQMTQEASNLTNALQGTGSHKVQGEWGEMILERLLEESGLHKGREYEVQKTLRDEDGTIRRPDVIIHLPDKKDVVIDAKVSLNAYSRYYQTDDEQLHKQYLDQHVRAIEQHVATLSSKNYSELYGIGSLDIVLLFVPVEGAYVLAIQHKPALFEQAFKQRIALISPSTLPSTLKIIHYLWRTENQNKSALDIAKRAGRLYDKVHGLVKDVEKLDGQLDTSRRTLSDVKTKLYAGRGNLVGQIKHFPQDGVPVKTHFDNRVTALSELSDED